VTIQIAGSEAHPTLAKSVTAVLKERTAETETSIDAVAEIDRASVVTPSAASRDDQLARVWIDLSDGGGGGGGGNSIMLFIADGPWERVLVRPVTREKNPEVTSEEIGHIVGSALVALRSGASIGIDRAAAREQLLPSSSSAATPSATLTLPPVTHDSPTEAPPPPRKEKVWTVRAGGYFLGSAYGDGFELATGPGVVVEGHRVVNHRWEVGALAMGEYHFPSTVDRGSAVVRFEGGGVYLLAHSTLALSAKSHVLFGAGGGVDLVHARATGDALSTIRFANGNLDANPSGRVLARYGLSVSSSLRLFAGLGVDIPLSQSRYLLSRQQPGTEPIVLFEPWAARPFLMLGLQTN
jgi:hypothetical protein